uniref:Uncharacterized protein n=1 Tax=Micrurus spixii TaxID=129469 RepID=A0A2D4MRK5_9SAUR
MEPSPHWTQVLHWGGRGLVLALRQIVPEEPQTLGSGLLRQPCGLLTDAQLRDFHSRMNQVWLSETSSFRRTEIQQPPLALSLRQASLSPLSRSTRDSLFTHTHPLLTP